MAMLTVDDLARDLKVKNEDLIRQLATMGYDVEGPESPLETDDADALRAELVTALPQREVIEKRIKPTVIRRRIKKKALSGEPEETFEEEPAERSMAPIQAAQDTRERPTAIEKPEAKIKPGARKGAKKKPEPAKIIEKATKSPEARPVAETSHSAAWGKVRKEVKPSGDRATRAGQSAVTLAPAAAEGARARTKESEPGKSGVFAIPREAAAATRERKAAGIQEVDRTSYRVEGLDHAEMKDDLDERPARKKKRKDKRIQPAQIIGRVELRRELREEPEREAEPARPVEIGRLRPAPVARPELPHEGPSDEVSDEEKRKKRKKDKKKRETLDDKTEDEKGTVRRRKEVLLRKDLYDDGSRPGRLRAKGKKPKQRKTEITTPKASKRRIKLTEVVSIAGLSHKMSIKASEVIQYLLSQGVTATVNEGIDYETASLVANEFGFEPEAAEHTEKDLLPAKITDSAEDLVARPPVVTMMGHVDHGKTSLLDYIRATHVTDQEAGGITQHIGAYKVKLDKGEVVFLDTPGHEAFTAMRARGAGVTDFVVLVVAADDGVMEQTREAVNHARAAEVPIVVAVNKIDKPEADKDRALRELSQLELIPEEWGGETLFAYMSAKTGQGISDLLDAILLQAEMMELRANPNKRASGTVIEARLDKGKGPMATVLVKEGTLRLGDPFVAGTHYGKVRAMSDHEGRSLTEAGPATPVSIQGFSGVPEAGEVFLVVDEERMARQIGSHRQLKLREQESAVTAVPVSVEELMARMQEEPTKDLNLIIKADVQGSVEAVKESLVGLSAQEITVKVIHSGVGTVTESDVMLAAASEAMIVGFNVRPSPKTAQLAEEKRVAVRLYNVIYEAIEDVRKAMEGLLAPVEKEQVVGHAEVRQTFHISKVGTIAGCYVTSGKIQRSNNVRLLRDNVAIYDGKIASMKRYKEDAKEAPEGYECGISLQNFNDIKVGDIIESFIVEQESAKLSQPV